MRRIKIAKGNKEAKKAKKAIRILKNNYELLYYYYCKSQ